MPNPVYTYDLLVNSLWITLFLNELELICLHTVNWFYALPFNIRLSSCVLWHINSCRLFNAKSCFIYIYIYIYIYDL